MRRAIKLALKAQYKTDPNPVVGAVLVNSAGDIISEGYHHKAGSPHAEVNALQNFDISPEGSTLFVTLEPCSHYGKTPPCAELIIKKKVKTVVVGTLDPNPLVAGRGIEMIKEAGIKVISGVCEEECRDINKVFNKHITTQKPYVTLKAAASLDGKIAMPSGESQWITGAEARKVGHILRSQHQAIGVGRKTLMIDNPKLTDRISEDPQQPIRVVFTTKGEIPENVFFMEKEGSQRIVISGNGIAVEQKENLEKKDIKVLVSDQEIPDVEWILKSLYKEGVCSLLLEGGAEITARFIQEKQVDQVYLFLSGKIIGSQNAPSWTGTLGIESLKDVPQLKFHHFEQVGEDMLLVGKFKPN